MWFNEVDKNFFMLNSCKKYIKKIFWLFQNFDLNKRCENETEDNHAKYELDSAIHFPTKFHDLWFSQRPLASEGVKRNIFLQIIVNLWVSTVKNCKIRRKFKFGRKVKIVASLNLGRWRVRTSPDLSWKHRVIHSYFRPLYQNFISSLK